MFHLTPNAMKTLTYIISTVATLVVTISLAGEPDSGVFNLTRGNSAYRSSFTMASHLVVIPVAINGSDSMNFILDSGVGSTLITEVSSGGVVSLNDARKVLVTGLGNSESLEALASENNSLQVGRLVGHNQKVIVLLNDVFNLSTRMGISINGLIGRTVFEQFVVEINYVNHSLAFYNPERFRTQLRRNEEAIPIKIIEGKPYVDVVVTNGGVERTVTLLLDTGMSFALWLDPNSNSGIKPKENARADVLGQGLNGNVTGQISRVDKVKIGTFELANVITAFPDTSSISEVSITQGRSGSIGADIFRRFNVIFDYPHNRLILRKNGNFSEKFEYDMSGLEVGTVVVGLPAYQVLSVGHSTPAEEAGILPDDQIYSINGVQANTLTLSEIADLFKSREGKSITMVVYRNGVKMLFKFKLRRLV